MNADIVVTHRSIVSQSYQTEIPLRFAESSKILILGLLVERILYIVAHQNPSKAADQSC